MKSFTKIVKNYETVARIGKEIIGHKDLIRRTAPENLDREFQKQEARINKFRKVAQKAEEDWKHNPYSVNSYWTGLS